MCQTASTGLRLHKFVKLEEPDYIKGTQILAIFANLSVESLDKLCETRIRSTTPWHKGWTGHVKMKDFEKLGEIKVLNAAQSKLID